METRTGESPIGTLDALQMGVSADGQSCMMVFVDEEQRSIQYVADFAAFNAFIASLSRMAGEMHRRRCAVGDDKGKGGGALTVTSGHFQLSPDSQVEGRLVGDSGQIVNIRMCPEVACQLTKAILMSAPAASDC